MFSRHDYYYYCDSPYVTAEMTYLQLNKNDIIMGFQTMRMIAFTVEHSASRWNVLCTREKHHKMLNAHRKDIFIINNQDDVRYPNERKSTPNTCKKNMCLYAWQRGYNIICFVWRETENTNVKCSLEFISKIFIVCLFKIYQKCANFDILRTVIG